MHTPSAADVSEDRLSDPTPRRLLFIVNQARFFLSHRAPIAAAAAARGWQVHVAVPIDDERLREEIAATGATVHAVTMSRAGLHPLENFASAISLFRVCRRVKPDIVHLVALKAVLVGSLAAKAAGIRRRVLAIAGLGCVFQQNDLKSWLMRSVFRLLLPVLLGCQGRMIVQNDADRTQIGRSSWMRSRIELIPGSGVDLTAFQPREGLPRPPFVVLLPARMIWMKGVGEFVEAARILAARRTDIRLQLAGEPDPGNPRTVPPETLEAWQAEGIVDWLGHHDDMPAVLGAAHAVCLPSYYGEGVPKCLQEAAAAGKPVITTDMPGCRAAVEPDESALLVPPRAPEPLAEAIARLADDPALCAQLGRAGRALAEARFGIDAVVRRHLEIYQSMGFPAPQGAAGEGVDPLR